MANHPLHSQGPAVHGRHLDDEGKEVILHASLRDIVLDNKSRQKFRVTGLHCPYASPASFATKSQWTCWLPLRFSQVHMYLVLTKASLFARNILWLTCLEFKQEAVDKSFPWQICHGFHSVVDKELGRPVRSSWNHDHVIRSSCLISLTFSSGSGWGKHAKVH